MTAAPLACPARLPRIPAHLPRRGACSLITLALCGSLVCSAPALAYKPGQTVPAGVLPQLKAITYGQGSVAAPAATATGNYLRINQQSQQMILDWHKFDIAAGSEVRFFQPNETAEALNRIFDADPSIIQGRLTANGRVYLINSNGILFDKGAQVDVRGLIASSLAVSEAVFKKGVFANGAVTPAFEGSYLLDANGNPVLSAVAGTGEVINKGTIRSIDPDTGGSPGGFVMLFAPKVGNEGLMVADNGQLVLAAGQKVYLSPKLKDGTVDELDLSMRGMLVEIDAGAEPLNVSSLVSSNLGVLQANRGNVTMAGMLVNQSGRITASSAVNQNGSIWLLARERISGAARGGELLLGKGSVTETPLASDGTTMAEGDDYTDYRARVKLDGSTIHIQGSVVAKGGIVDIGLDATASAALQTSRVLLDEGGSIDVSGSFADLDITKNLLTFKITSDDLKNSYLQKGGFLLGKSVTVDTRKGDPLLLDITAAKANMRRTVQEKAASGGDINVNATEFIAKAGSTIDYSGGGYRYATGRMGSSMLLSGGRLYDFSSAPADLTYDGIITPVLEVEHAKWGVTEQFASPAAMLAPVEQGYVEGKPAGTMTIDAATAVLQGALRAGVSVGPYQLGGGAMPVGGKLILGNGVKALGDPGDPKFRMGEVSFQAHQSLLPVDFGMADTLLGPQTVLPDNLFGGVTTGPGGEYRTTGPAAVEIYAGGKFVVGEGAAITAPAGASLTAYGRQVQVDGDIVLPSGSIELNAIATAAGEGNLAVVVAEGSTLSVAGQWINGSLPGAGLLPLLTDGGSISLSGRGVDLRAGSLLDVSGGARLDSDRRLQGGDAGSIALSAGPVGQVGGDDPQEAFGPLRLEGELRGYGAGGKGGSVSLTAATARIGGAARSDRDLALDPAFFQQGGFTEYKVSGYFDAEVLPGTVVNPLASIRSVNLAPAGQQPTGTDLTGFSVVQLPEQALRQAASFELSSGYAPGVGRTYQPTADAPGGLRIGKGSVIRVDPGASVSLASKSRMDVDGTVDAPAGTISLSLDAADNTYGGQQLRLGATGRLLARGTLIPQPNAAGRLEGELLAGGEVQLHASKNDLVLESGSLIDVSGASAQLDLPAGGGTSFARSTVGSEGGAIVIKATENVRLEGNLVAGGGAAAAGGSFTLDLRYHGNVVESAVPGLENRRHVIAFSQAGGVTSVAGANTASVAANRLMAAGFERINLAAEDAIEFSGNLELAAAGQLQLDAPEIAATGPGAVTLSAGKFRLQNTPATFRPQGGLAPVATREGDATLGVDADLVELRGHVTLNGFGDVRLASRGDLRAVGFPVATNASPSEAVTAETRQALNGGLTTPANLTLAATQIYPATAVDYVISLAQRDAAGNAVEAAGRTLVVEGVGGTAAPVLSAGGRLRLEAETIRHDGTVKAPLGTVELAAGGDLVLTGRSVTSVSAEGQTIPFGVTVNGETLFYGALDRSTTPPEKGIRLEAPRVDIAPTAELDVSGGGELQAVEFVSGIGGTRDVLLAKGTYAIVPGLSQGASDAQLAGLADLGLDTDASLYDSVVFGEGGPLPAGRYVLLPGYYALLPGAYAVTKSDSSQILAPGTTAVMAGGKTLVAGRMASSASGAAESLWKGFVVQSGENVLRQAEYRISGSDFYREAAAAAERAVPQLPADAGRLAIAATEAIAFGGILKTLPGQGGGIGQVDIAAPKIAVVSQLGQERTPAGFVELEADRLSQLGASVLLGGTRASDAGGTRVDVVASEVIARNDENHVLSTPELILAAKDRVSVESGSVLEGAGQFSGEARDLVVADDGADSQGALLRLSSSGGVTVRRGAITGGSLGELDVAEGAELRATGSLLLDATRTTRSKGVLTVAAGGSASFAGGSVSLGQTGAVTEGLVMDQDRLAALAALGDLTLRSYGSLDLYGTMSFGNSGVRRLTLDASVIAGHGVDGASQAKLTAATLVLQNSGTAAASDPAGGTGTLELSAGRIELGEGTKAIAGFQSVKLAAAGEIAGTGKGTLKVGGDLDLVASRITGLAGSNQTLQAKDAAAWRDVRITLPASPAELAAAQAGGQLAILGKSVLMDGRIELPAGSLELGARGSERSDGVHLTQRAAIAAGGFAKDFAGTKVAASAGQVTLSADHGDVDVDAGALVDLAGTADGGDAGELVVKAPEGVLNLAGSVLGGAAEGYDTGSAEIDVGSLANYVQVNEALNAGSFTQRRHLRVRTGDVTIPSGQAAVKARDFKLTADEGSITLGGVIDVSGAEGGGRAELIAAQDLHLLDGSLIDARGTSNATGESDAYSHGGKVVLTSVSGSLDFDAGAVVDASAAADGKSDGGEILFVASRNTRPDGTPGVAMNLAGTVNVSGAAARSAGSVIVEGARRYGGITSTTDDVAADATNAVWLEYSDFMNNAAAIRGDLALRNADGTAFDPAALRVRAGIELASAGDMTHSSAWNLTASGWRIDGEAGRLTLRAAGNLTISNALGFPNDNLPSGHTWSLRLVGGADLASADALATTRSDLSGDVVLSTATARVRTGDGDIDVAAGRDFAIGNASAAIYTAGVPVLTDFILGAALNRFAIGGGDISLVAGRDAIGTAGSASVTDWLRRNTNGTLFDSRGRWWVHRPTFRHNIGALAGGSISIRALRSVDHLSAVIPTSGRAFTDADGKVQLAVAGGGDLRVLAGADVIGGDYLIGRGRGAVKAGGDLGMLAPTALFLMGESDDPALRHADFAVEALGNVTLKSVSNPTILALTRPARPSGDFTSVGFGASGMSFFTYAPDASVSVVAAAGDVTPVASGVDYVMRILPSRIRMAALQGGIKGAVPLSDVADTDWIPFPSPESSVALYAAGDIRDQWVKLGDTDPVDLPTWRAPILGVLGSGSAIQSLLDPLFLSPSRDRLVQRSAQAGYRYQVVTESGDIRESVFEFPQQAAVLAGGDMVNLRLELQNLDSDDVSVVRAGNDIRYTTFTSARQEVSPVSHYIRIGGPGRLVVQAGGDIDFGPAAGIDAVGNLVNDDLPNGRSAAVTALAGVQGDISQAQLENLFAELKAAGLDGDAARGDAAIAAVFNSTNSGPGSINMVKAGIQTRGDSSIDVLAPNGSIEVGLPTELTPRPATQGSGDKNLQIGIITAAGGAIRTLVGDDIDVNLSKMVTLLGGDILIYAREGNIDAGRGPRDSVSSLAPQVDRVLAPNAEGKLVDSGLRRMRPPVDAAGSGIRTVSFDPDGPDGPIAKPEPGSVYLFASRGFVDAGEAGVSAAGDIIVVAEQVFNANNFSAGGSSTGVPVSDAGALAGALVASSATSAGAGQGAEEIARSASTSTQTGESFRPSFITVEVIGFGD